ALCNKAGFHRTSCRADGARLTCPTSLISCFRRSAHGPPSSRVAPSRLGDGRAGAPRRGSGKNSGETRRGARRAVKGQRVSRRRAVFQSAVKPAVVPKCGETGAVAKCGESAVGGGGAGAGLDDRPACWQSGLQRKPLCNRRSIMTDRDDEQLDGGATTPAEALAAIRASQEAVRDQTRPDSTRMFVVWGVAYLVAYVALYLGFDREGQTPGGWSLAVLGVSVVAAMAYTAVHITRRTSGIRGSSAMVGRTFGWAWVLGFGFAAVIV